MRGDSAVAHQGARHDAWYKLPSVERESTTSADDVPEDGAPAVCMALRYVSHASGALSVVVIGARRFPAPPLGEQPYRPFVKLCYGPGPYAAALSPQATETKNPEMPLVWNSRFLGALPSGVMPPSTLTFTVVHPSPRMDNVLGTATLPLGSVFASEAGALEMWLDVLPPPTATRRQCVE